MPWSSSYLHKLELHVGVKLATMRTCYDLSEQTLEELSQTVGDKLPAEASFVVFGSLARKEFTAGSDLDWCLMIDGKADAGHRDLEREVTLALKKSGKFKNPAPTGAFGALVFGHEIIHCIGGSADTNANLTRRLLLLLESAETSPHSQLSPRQRLMRGVLQRYFEEEANFPGKDFFPRFFLNDVVRYWRTIAVDYAAKNNERGAEGWALRNAKLRFSRKLLYIAGLLLTYETTLFPATDLIPKEDGTQLSFFDKAEPQLSSTEHCFHALQLTPLELLARTCMNLDLPKAEVKILFQTYDKFLSLLEANAKREQLKGLNFDDAPQHAVFLEVRKHGHAFQAALEKLFLMPGTKLGDLTLKYGIF
jgi:predicted nucleotidyltransferase